MPTTAVLAAALLEVLNEDTEAVAPRTPAEIAADVRNAATRRRALLGFSS